ncbi:hydroxymethylglutaryl-CoA synthase family protein [Photobacterium sp. 1_MG-2023]|uniref:hydroxymethylglutaryl-CoA synthase family protein n=1 Tax=Photobacterium sp. 1_MG-2023 TaxID=3062646 RepID=UPI0026E14381|nr:hydroxymethylglutaryl-CoA synthase family protein [Photobacterium sp. 1_MG-2023]MDO6706110.1 hydroxymethylglutaryl-CoA synthase family protein [Photobacterium sp. 1_MG-2023]
MRVGIEAINLYAGVTCMDVLTIFKQRDLQIDRFDNLMMNKKSVGLPNEDAVTCGVNAAIKLIRNMSDAEKDRIEMVITSTESGVDFGKSISTYIHDYLNLNNACRVFEVKQACYGGTAALQQAVNYVASGVSPGGKVLVIATDIARHANLNYAEPTQSIGAVAMLVSDNPQILEIDFGAIGQHSYEVMDTCRPETELETGNPDLSLLSYLDCLENCYKRYEEKVENSDFRHTFDYLAFHTPFCGMVKGAHRKVMRSLYRTKPNEIDIDFMERVKPSLTYCQDVGNVYSATLYFALCGIIDNADFDDEKRVGMFSYGSGCSSEFFSGVILPFAKEKLAEMKIKERLEQRYPLSTEEYELLLKLNSEWTFGIKDRFVDLTPFKKIYEKTMAGKGLLALVGIEDYHRKYQWT